MGKVTIPPQPFSDKMTSISGIHVIVLSKGNFESHLDIAKVHGYTVSVINSNQRRCFMIDALATVCIFVNDQDRAGCMKSL